MDIEFFNDPWEHAVIDNFFPPEIFNQLVRLEKQFIEFYDETHSMKEHMAWMQDRYGDMSFRTSVNDEKASTYAKLFPELLECYDLLREHFAETHDTLTTTLYNKWTDGSPPEFKFAIQIQPPNYQYHIHPDNPWKKMSTTVFLSEDNIGTWLYESIDQDYHQPSKKVEWKPNRALVFVGTDTTFHSFHTNSEEKMRVTLVHNFADS